MFLEENFVTLEIGKLLKEVNFDQECVAYWVINENGEAEEHFLPINATSADFGDLNQNNISNFVSRPLWQQMFKWFRSKYDFTSSIYIDHNKIWHWKLQDEKVFGGIKVENFGEAESQEEARLLYVKRAVFKIQNPNTFEETVHERSLRKLQEYLDSPASDKYFEEIRIKEELQQARFVKFEEYLKTIDFSEILKRLIGEHDDAYRDKCYSRGYEPHPNNKLQFVLDYVSEKGEKQAPGSVDDNPFEAALYLYKDYYFQLSQGQGAFWRIFNKEKESIFTS